MRLRLIVLENLEVDLTSTIGLVNFYIPCMGLYVLNMKLCISKL